MPRLIVMMPVRNVQDTVRLALSSTLRALPADGRVVVWDDASTDDTYSVVSDFVGSRVELIRSDHSVGGGAARAAILKATDSEFVASMDGDDVCLPWRFKLQGTHVRELDAVFMTNVKFGAKLTDLRPSLPLRYRPTDIAVALAFHNPLTHPSFFGRRSTLDQVGGYRDLKVAQDYDLWMRMAAGGHRIGRLGLPGIAYRRSSSQISAQRNYFERIRRQKDIVDSYLSLLDYLSPGLERAVKSNELTDASKSNMVACALLESLQRMQPILRPYYRNLINRQLMGPLWQCWVLDQREL